MQNITFKLFITVTLFLNVSFSSAISDGYDTIRSALKIYAPSVSPDVISPTDISGIYVLEVDKKDYFMTTDGTYLIDEAKMVNLAEHLSSKYYKDNKKEIDRKYLQEQADLRAARKAARTPEQVEEERKRFKALNEWADRLAARSDEDKTELQKRIEESFTSRSESYESIDFEALELKRNKKVVIDEYKQSFHNLVSTGSEYEIVKKSSSRVAKSFGLEIDSIVKSPIKSLYEIVTNTMIFYMSVDGAFLLTGKIYNLETKVDITEKAEKKFRLKNLGLLDSESMIIYKKSGNAKKHVVYVFIEVDEPYSKQLYDQTEDYNKLGFELRYVAYPRLGVEGEGVSKTTAVWCAQDKHKALELAMNGASLKKLKSLKKSYDPSCRSYVHTSKQMTKYRITGLPALIIEDGALLPGYVPPEKLITAF